MQLKYEYLYMYNNTINNLPIVLGLQVYNNNYTNIIFYFYTVGIHQYIVLL